MYIIKTRERLYRILEDNEFGVFNNDKVIINNCEIYGLKYIMDNLNRIVEGYGLLETSSFNIIHGDLCFSNVLYDIRNRIIKLIDPRGKFGQFDIYGDHKYDIAKLCHSIHGGYDFILNGHFHYTESKNGVKLDIFEKSHHIAIQELFNKQFLSFWYNDIKKIHLIESLLFISLVPLHKDKPLAQKAFLSRGLLLLDEALVK
jgi:hypothetical protein